MKLFKSVFICLILGLAVMLAVMPVAAQEEVDEPMMNTVTVLGTGEANGTPDIATLETGVESRNEDVAAAFAETNQKLQVIIDALLEAGVLREDIRTSGLNIWQDYSGIYGAAPPFMPQPEPVATEEGGEPPAPVFVVSNSLSVTIRDIAIAPTAIDIVVKNGATSLYGLYFGIDDTTALETEARAEAFADALNRAQQLAALSGAELGDALIITEGMGGYYPPSPYALSGIPASFGGGDGGAVIEPGQLSVSLQVQVTFRINR